MNDGDAKPPKSEKRTVNHMNNYYTVSVSNVPPQFGSGYFPRHFRYQKDAGDCAARVSKAGANCAFVKCPNGRVLKYVQGKLA